MERGCVAGKTAQIKPVSLQRVKPPYGKGRFQSHGQALLGPAGHRGNDHCRLRKGRLIGQTDIDLGLHAGGNEFGEPGRRPTGQLHARLAAPQIDDPHVAPENAAAKPRTEGLRTGFLGGKPFREAVGALTGATLANAPKGYAVTHPAIEYLRFKQFFASRELEPGIATSDRFYPELLQTFRAVAPLVRFLNTPLLAGGRAGLSDVPFPRSR